MRLHNNKLKSFFIGTLLGDSYIHNGVFCCKQISKDLIDFKYNFIRKFLPCAKIKYSEHEEYTDKNGIHHQKYYTIEVSKSKYIKKLYDLFYENGKKVYKPGMLKHLDNLGFAMWYADDGTSIIVQNGKNRRVQICTDCFTEEEHEYIKNDFNDIGIENIKIIDRYKNGQLRIQINGIYRQTFLINMSKYFYKYFPSLLYKIDLGYRGETLDKNFVLPEYKTCYLKISNHNEFRDRIKYK